jgi:hypothetical protein
MTLVLIVDDEKALRVVSPRPFAISAMRPW